MLMPMCFWPPSSVVSGIHGNTAKLTGQPSPNYEYAWDPVWNLSPERSPGLATFLFDDMLMHRDEGPFLSTEMQYGALTYSCHPAGAYQGLDLSLDSFGSQPAEDIEGEF